MSLKSILCNYIVEQYNVPLNDLLQIAQKNNYKESNCERRLRELRKDGKVVGVMKDGVVVGYKYNFDF